MGKQKEKDKDFKTNAMRILDKHHIVYTVNTYACDTFIDGIHVADQLHQSYENSFKTLVTVGKSGNYFVFLIPIAEELDLKKAAKAVGEKSVEMIHVKDIQSVTGYIRGGCTPIGMKKNYPTVIDKSAARFETMIISGGRIGSQIVLRPDDLLQVTKAKLEDLIL